MDRGLPPQRMSLSLRMRARKHRRASRRARAQHGRASGGRLDDALEFLALLLGQSASPDRFRHPAVAHVAGHELFHWQAQFRPLNHDEDDEYEEEDQGLSGRRG